MVTGLRIAEHDGGAGTRLGGGQQQIIGAGADHLSDVVEDEDLDTLERVGDLAAVGERAGVR